jgi:outer membrane cobalamin receptor
MAELLELTVYTQDGEVDYKITGYQREIDQELDLLDPAVEYNLETSPWNATLQSARALSEANTHFNRETARC